jgi:hypothetical protein
VGPILVFGHRNPDNDSICSAVAYAHLKNLTDPATSTFRLGSALRPKRPRGCSSVSACSSPSTSRTFTRAFVMS